MHKIRKRARKLPHAGKAKRFPPRVTFLAGGDFRARSNIPEENEGLLVVVEQPGTRCPRLSRAGGDFPARSTILEENKGLLVVVEQLETECLWLVAIAGGDFPASSIIPEENGGLRAVECKCNLKAIS